jgi:hypothetical protein
VKEEGQILGIKMIINKKNIIMLGGILSIVGLIGPWLHFSEYDQGSMYYFDMSPFYLSVEVVPNDLNLSPTQETHFFYRTDASFLGILNLVGGILVLAGMILSKVRISWIGLSLIFLSVMFFPTVLPIIFSDTESRWGFIFTITGMIMILVTLCIEFISKKYDMGFPRR